MVVGPTSSALAWLCSYPQDLIKTKLQINAPGTYQRSKWLPDGGIIECSKEIYRLNGWKGFFSGLSPCLIRAAYSEGIGIMAYEKARESMWHMRTPKE